MPEPTAIVDADTIRPGFNETGVVIARRLFVTKVAGSTVDSVELPALGARAIGVTMDAIPLLGRGNIQTTGQAIITSSAAILRGAEITAAATGKAITAVATNVILGWARSAASGADIDVEVELAGPMGAAIKP